MIKQGEVGPFSRSGDCPTKEVVRGRAGGGGRDEAPNLGSGGGGHRGSGGGGRGVKVWFDTSGTGRP